MEITQRTNRRQAILVCGLPILFLILLSLTTACIRTLVSPHGSLARTTPESKYSSEAERRSVWNTLQRMERETRETHGTAKVSVREVRLILLHIHDAEGCACP